MMSYSSSVKSGSGNIEVGSVISDQLEMMEEFSFPMGDNGSVSVDNEGVFSVEIEYSADIDEHTTISASISAKSDMSITAGYTITTNDGYHNIVSTSIELTHIAKMQNPPAKQPESEVVPVILPLDEQNNAPSTAPELSLDLSLSMTSSHTLLPKLDVDWDIAGLSMETLIIAAVACLGVGSFALIGV